jgi:DNA-binding response OmpR family regulator
MTTSRSVIARILTVDDDVEVQKVVKRAAEAAGLEVVQAFDGAAGLALALTEPFDLILLDINMPKMDGRDVLSKLRNNHATAAVPVLIYSGRAGQLDRLVGLELGADDYIDKPFESSLLVKKIERLIQARSEVVDKRE